MAGEFAGRWSELSLMPGLGGSGRAIGQEPAPVGIFLEITIQPAGEGKRSR